jgi:DNA helicase-2/ATP-dependent DNA helicase PcrA
MTREPIQGQLGLDLDVPVIAPAPRRPAAGPPGRPGEPVSAVRIAQLLGRPEPTPEQVAVIEAPLEPMLVIAGAGSGKTETMAARVVWLVANRMIEPDQVLGLTFTRKAAGELAERVRARLRALHRRNLIAEPRPVTVSTYHAYAAGILGDHALRLGIEPGAQLLGEAGGWQLVDELVERWDGDMASVESARVTVVDAVLALAGECAEHLLDPARIEAELDAVLERIATLPATLGDAAPGKPRAEVKKIGERLEARKRLLPLAQAYRARKRELELLDFGDQVALAAQLARDVPAVGAGERERYRVVLLDEYQDTSHAQVVLLQSLFGGAHPVVAVGDPHQSIYAWRGASAGNLQRFCQNFPHADGGPAPVRQLSTSWRNDLAVLTAANELAAPLRNPPEWARRDLQGQVEVQPLVPRNGAGPGRVRLEWHATIEDEARAVADLAHFSWHQPGPGGGRRSIAVLCRTRAQFPLIEAALRSKGLPVEVIGLGGLLHVPEISDLRAALQVVHDPTRGDSLMRLLTGPSCRLGPRDLDGLGAWARSRTARAQQAERADQAARAGAAQPTAARPTAAEPTAARPTAAQPTAELDAADEQSIVDAMDELPPPEWTGSQGQEISVAGRHRLERLATVLRGLRSRARLPLPDLVLEAERALLLDVEVAALPGRSPAAARAHLDAFIDVAASFADTGDRPTLGTFLAWLDAAEAQERGLDTGVVEQHEDAVQLLTVHGSKGLEWDVVAVTGLVEGTFPAGVNGSSPRTSKGWLTDLGAVPFPLRGDAGGLPQWEYRSAQTQAELETELKEFMQRCGEHEVAEERRLAYVAVTRARQSLALTGAIWADGVRPRPPSRFLETMRELAADPASGVTIGLWTDTPEDGAQNPRQVEGRLMDWPVEMSHERKAVLESGAQLVQQALVALADARFDDRDGGEGGRTGYEADWAHEVDLLLAERDTAARGERIVRLPAHLSASRVVALAQDPQALAQRLRRPMPEPPSPHARRGSTFHAWLERRFGAAALVDVDELPGSSDEVDTTDEAELAALQATFLASEWASRTAEAVEVAVETPVAGLVLRGRIDAVFARPDGGWDVVDWKTGQPPHGRRAQSLAVQLAVYRLAWSRLQGVPIERVSAAFFYASTGDTVRPVDLFSEAELEALLTL